MLDCLCFAGKVAGWPLDGGMTDCPRGDVRIAVARSRIWVCVKVKCEKLNRERRLKKDTAFVQSRLLRVSFEGFLTHLP